MKKRVLILSSILGLANTIHAEVLTETQLHTMLGVVTNFILDGSAKSVTHNGVTYRTVTSPYTGRVWLDRNLGASRVCASLDDTACYGDYYQWGRNHDGHQENNSSITALKATDVINTGSEFIVSNSVNNFDWASVDTNGAIRTNNWFEEGSNAVCPTGFRVPTIEEIKAELLDVGVAEIVNNTAAFNSFLKLPSAGLRGFTGNMAEEGIKGYLWSLTDNGYRASYILFDDSLVSISIFARRASAISVRCIKKFEPEEYLHNRTIYSVVTSPYTGKVWLDRNLGANRICTSQDDAECYGDFYQWGRNADGHEVITSNSTSILASDIANVGHGDFIINSTVPNDWASVDLTGSGRSSNWSATDGSSVCPIGFRVPDLLELQAELLDVGSAEIANSTDAFNSFLVLPSAGFRSFIDTVSLQGAQGFMWSRSISNSVDSYFIHFSNTTAQIDFDGRSFAFMVRCLKKLEVD